MPLENLLAAETVPATEILSERVQDHPYDEYWNIVADFYRGIGEPDVARIANHNQSDLRQLEANLLEPRSTSLGKKTIQAERVAEQWYLELGSLNSLQGAAKPLLVSFIQLWKSACGLSGSAKELPAVMRQAGMAISSVDVDGGRVSEEIRDMVDDPDRASRALLAGNALLDYVRSVPQGQRTSTHTTYLNLTRRLNEGLLFSAAAKEPDDKQKRIVSDALKFKYEAMFEILASEHSSGALDDAQYKERLNLVLYHQLGETVKLATNNRLTNGDLHEHYFGALLRHSLMGASEGTGFSVQASTRRQDAPLDGLAARNLPALSFDAKVIDQTGTTPEQLIQLKLPGAQSRKYEKGIKVVDSLLAGTNNYEQHHEILTGLKQLRAVVYARATDTAFSGETPQLSSHLEALHESLQIAA